MRPTALALPLLCLGLAACGPSGSDPAKPGDAGEAEKKREAPPITTTGIAVIQHDVTELHEDLVKIEKKLEKGETVRPLPRRALLKRWKILDKACADAAGRLAEQNYHRRYAMLRKELGDLNKSVMADRAEAASIQKDVEAARAGIGEIPVGFTEAELMDKAGRLLERARATEKTVEEHKKKMRPMEETFAKGGPFELNERSMFTDEAEALRKLKPRIDALQPG